MGRKVRRRAADGSRDRGGNTGRDGGPGPGPSGARGPRPPGSPDIPVVEALDLHGLAIDEAMVQVELALERWRNRPGACLRVIHGQSSGSRDSIKGTLRRNLETAWKNRIRSFRQEPANPGATLILIGN